MFVRVFDQKRNTYYRSMAYAVLGSGLEQQYIVLDPHTHCFELADYLDNQSQSPRALVDVIQSECSGFLTYHGAQMLKYKHFCKINGYEFADIRDLKGYPEVLENSEFLADIFAGKCVPLETCGIPEKTFPDAVQWNYILTQADADAFMKQFSGFHDSILEAVRYCEDGHSAAAYAVFENCERSGATELCFEGVQMMRIKSPALVCFRNISDASLILENETVFWADASLKKPDESYDGSFIRALCLKWRKIR